MGNVKISGTTNQNARASVFTEHEYLGYRDISGSYSIVMCHPQPYIATLDDNFNGTNGNPPDADRWQILQGDPEIQSNNLYLEHVAISGTTRHEMRSRYVLSGNVRMEMLIDLTGQNNSSNWYLQISVLDLERQNGGRIYVRQGRYIHTVKVVDGVETDVGNIFMGATWNSAGIGIRRDGDHWYSLRWSPGWSNNIDHDWTGGHTGNVKVEIKSWHGDTLPAFDPSITSVDVATGTAVVSGTGSADMYLFATVTGTGETKAYGKVTAIDTGDSVNLTEWPSP